MPEGTAGYSCVLRTPLHTFLLPALRHGGLVVVAVKSSLCLAVIEARASHLFREWLNGELGPACIK